MDTFLLYPHENWSKVLGYQGWDEILMITLISSQKSPTSNISAPTVRKIEENVSATSINLFRELRQYDRCNTMLLQLHTIEHFLEKTSPILEPRPKQDLDVYILIKT